MSIHDYRIGVWIQKMEDRIGSADYSENNKTKILQFESYLFAEGLKPIRVSKYLEILNMLAIDAPKDFLEMGRLDVQDIVAKVEKSKRASSTKREYKVIIRRFFRWLQGEENAASWLKTNFKHSERKLPDQLITEDEVKKMIEAAEHPRDKAIIAVLYDSGCRIGELGSIQIKNVSFDQYGAILQVHGKTGSRRVRITFSATYLAAWLDIHPWKKKPESFVYVKINGSDRQEQMQYYALRYVIVELAKKAGIQKRIHPHLFRHSRSTELAQYLTEAQMEEHLGWVHGSEMPRTYVHLSGKQIDDAILSIYGEKKSENKMPELASKFCSRCKKKNGPTSTFCSQCGMSLDQKVAFDMTEKRSKLPELLNLIMSSEEGRQLYFELQNEMNK